MKRELQLTAAQERRRRNIETRLQRVLRDLRDLAVEAGCERPSLFYECEGRLVVFDEARGDPGQGSAAQRQDKVALSIWTLGKDTPNLDCGAW